MFLKKLIKYNIPYLLIEADVGYAEKQHGKRYKAKGYCIFTKSNGLMEE